MICSVRRSQPVADRARVSVKGDIDMHDPRILRLEVRLPSSPEGSQHRSRPCRDLCGCGSGGRRQRPESGAGAGCRRRYQRARRSGGRIGLRRDERKRPGHAGRGDREGIRQTDDLVSNAGGGDPKPFDMPMDDFHHAFDLNVFSLFRLTQLAAPVMAIRTACGWPLYQAFEFAFPTIVGFLTVIRC